MRYIGNKTKLLEFLKESIFSTLKENNIELNEIEHFYDLFSGTGSVAEHFKNDFNVVGNDILVSSYIITQAKLLPEIPSSEFFQEIFDNINLKSTQGFITEKYSEGSNRLYFSKENGMKIDGVRLYLEENKDRLKEEEYYYLLYCILEQIHRVSNTTGVYGAYLKKLSSNALKKINIEKIPIIKSSFQHKCYNTDCINIINEIGEKDIIYIDPPYNERQYGSNYHLLETIVKYDNPEIKIVRNKTSVTGLRKDLPESKWCKKSNIKQEITKILDSKSKFIFMSYNTEGLISEKEIIELFEKYGKVTIKRKVYKRYKSNKNGEEKLIEELLFCLVKL